MVSNNRFRVYNSGHSNNYTSFAQEISNRPRPHFRLQAMISRVQLHSTNQGRGRLMCFVAYFAFPEPDKEDDYFFYALKKKNHNIYEQNSNIGSKYFSWLITEH